MVTPNSSAINVACLKLSPLLTPCICPFLIRGTPSYPCNVRRAVLKEKKPIPGLTSRLMNRWSCSTRLFRYLLCRSSQETARTPAVCNSLRALGYAAFLSTVMTPESRCGKPRTLSRKSAWRSGASRVAFNKNSRVFPWESTARYRSIQIPLTLTYISSTRHESLVILRWGRQRFSNAGASCCTQR
jgi:hypothetical protein